MEQNNNKSIHIITPGLEDTILDVLIDEYRTKRLSTEYSKVGGVRADL